MGNNQKHSCESNLVPHPPRKKIYKSIYKSHFSPFRSHSGSFRFIPVSFRSIPVSFRFIPVSFRSHSGSFRFIPVRSGPFRSVPVFSNARAVLGHDYTRTQLLCNELQPSSNKFKPTRVRRRKYFTNRQTSI